MPRGDRTGPSGMGPMTGRGVGYCRGYGMPGYSNPVPGRGLGMGWGRRRGGGRGWRHRYYATGLPGWARFGYAPTWDAPPAWGPPPMWGPPPAPAYGPNYAPPAPEQEIDFLRDQAEWLSQQLEAISQCISELEQEE